MSASPLEDDLKRYRGLSLLEQLDVARKLFPGLMAELEEHLEEGQFRHADPRMQQLWSNVRPKWVGPMVGLEQALLAMCEVVVANKLASWPELQSLFTARAMDVRAGHAENNGELFAMPLDHLANACGLIGTAPSKTAVQ